MNQVTTGLAAAAAAAKILLCVQKWLRLPPSLKAGDSHKNYLMNWVLKIF